MKDSIATDLIGWIALVGLVLLLAVVIVIWMYFWPVDEKVRMQMLPFYIEAMKVIVTGIVVALFVAALPHAVNVAAQRFDRYRESRQAYSKAKTAVLYLPDRVKHLSAKDAFALVSDAHRELHLAETFADDITSKYLEWFGRSTVWLPYNYWQIVAVAEALRASKNPQSGEIHQLQLAAHLEKTGAVVQRYFMPNGSTDNRLPWKDDVTWEVRRSKEDEIQKAIRKATEGGALATG